MVDWATLANILNDYESWLALTYSIDQILIRSASVNSLAPLCNWIVAISFGTLSTKSIDSVISINANTLKCILIKYLILIATVAMIIGAGGDLNCRFAVVTVLSVSCSQEQQNEGKCFTHGFADFDIINNIICLATI